MKFYDWLLSINPKTNWSQDIDVLESQLADAIRVTEQLNLKKLIAEWAQNGDSGFKV